MYYGYHRVSTREQNLDRGIKGIEEFCKKREYKLEKIYTDKSTGRNTDRIRYTVLKEDVLREGDVLILYELDRLARTKKLIAEELEFFEKKGVRVMFLDIPTSTMDFKIEDKMSNMILSMFNKLIIEVYSMQAESEFERRSKRQREGIQAMKERGEWNRYGRPRRMEREEFSRHYKRVVNGELGSLALMRELGLSKDTYFRYVREYKMINSQYNCKVKNINQKE